MHTERIRHAGLADRLMSADDAARIVSNNMTVGMSGFTRAGDVKALPRALAARSEQARAEGKAPFSITVITGASLGHDSDAIMSNAGLLNRRLPFQVDSTLRRKINRGEVSFMDQHLSETAEQLRSGALPPVDVAIIEATCIQADGSIVPTMSVGNSAIFVSQAKYVIIELNTKAPLALEGLHDIYEPEALPARQAIPLTSPQQRIGRTSIPCSPDKIAAIVLTSDEDSPSSVSAPDAETAAIARHIVNFLKAEVETGRMGPSLMPIQAGIGNIANAVLHGLVDSPFHGITMYSEVLQDSAMALLDSGKLVSASASSITLSAAMAARFGQEIERYKSKLILRPQEISNHPEIIRRLGIIALNTALEFDIYGNVNSTHVGGTHMMNGIGGSGDFARNSRLSIFISKSIAKDGAVSSIVPMVPHVDHSEHDVDIVVSEIGLADLRGLTPRERAPRIIDNCAHPLYRAALHEYFRTASLRGGHTPHVLENAFSWHTRYASTGSMLEPSTPVDSASVAHEPQTENETEAGSHAITA